MPKPKHFTIGEIDSTYVHPSDRFVVSLIVGTGDEDTTMKEAAALALELTRDAGSATTVWNIHDRLTGETRLLEQDEFE